MSKTTTAAQGQSLTPNFTAVDYSKVRGTICALTNAAFSSSWPAHSAALCKCVCLATANDAQLPWCDDAD